MHCGNSNSDTALAIKKHSLVELPYKDFVTEEFQKEVLDGITMDDVMTTAIHDQAIMLFGNAFHESRREQKSKDYIIRVIRDLARLSMEIKKLNPTITTLQQAINPAHFDDFIKAALNMAGYDQTTGYVKVPSIAYRLSQPLNECVTKLKTLETKLIYQNKSGDRKKSTMFEDFLQQIQDEW